MKTSEAIRTRINSIAEGVIFGYDDLEIAAPNRYAAAMTLRRLVAQNQIRRAAKGRFYRPITTRLGEMPLSVQDVADGFLYKAGKHIGYITGTNAFAQMGITTQISSTVVIASAKYRRPTNRSGYRFTFITQPNLITADNIPLLRFLDALRFIKRIPAVTPTQVVVALLQLLQEMTTDQVSSLIELSQNYAPQVRAMLGAMLDSIGLRSDVLKQGLNQFSRFNCGIALESLPQSTYWQLQ